MLAIVGCSSDNSGEGNKPRSTVNSRLSPNAVAALTGQTAIFEAGNGAGGGGVQDSFLSRVVSEKASLAIRHATQAATGGAVATVQAKAERVTDVMHSSDCVTNVQEAQEPSQPGSPIAFKRVTVEVSGPNCGMEMNLKISVLGDPVQICNQSGSNFDCKFVGLVNLTYRIFDEQLQRDLGINRGHMNLSLDFEIHQSGGRQTGQPQTLDAEISAQFDVKTVDAEERSYTVVAKQALDFEITESSGSTQGQAKGSATETIDFRDESAGVSSNLKATLTASGRVANARFVVDGVEVTEGAYVNERAKIANSMMPKFGTNESFSTSESEGTSESGESTRANEPPRDWACLIRNLDESQVYIGTGSLEFVAESKARQACQYGEGAPCSWSVRCEMQERTSNAWYCEAKDLSTGLLSGGESNSRVQAQYEALQACFGGGNPSSCRAEDDRCVFQF